MTTDGELTLEGQAAAAATAAGTEPMAEATEPDGGEANPATEMTVATEPDGGEANPATETTVATEPDGADGADGAVPPPPVTSADGTAKLAEPAGLPVATATLASAAPPVTEAPEVAVQPGRRPRKRHRLRTKPWRTALVALIALLVAAALPLLGWKAAHTIANSHEGKAVEATTPVGQLPSTPAALLVGLDAAGQPASLTVFSVAADGKGGTAIVVPLATAAYLEGLAKPVRLDSAFGDGGLDAETRGVESVLGISTTASQTANEEQLAALLEPYAPVEVTFDTPVLETASNGSTREVISAGEHRLTAREAAQVLLARVDGESELARLPRQQAVWTALLDRAESASAASTTTPTSAGTPADAPSDVAGFLAAATSGPVGVHALRVQPSFDPSAPSGPELLQADVGYLRLLVATVMPGAVSPSNGNISFRIVNPLGSTEAAYQAVARLSAVQANVVLVTDVPGPAPERTTIVYQSPAGETQAAAFAPVLGAGTPTASAERIDGIDATVTLGQDFPAFLAAEAARTAATTTAVPPTTEAPSTSTGKRTTATTTKRTTSTTTKKGNG